MSNVAPTADQCPQCLKAIIGQHPPVLVDGKVVPVATVTITHFDNTKCVLPAASVPWLYQRPPVFWTPPPGAREEDFRPRVDRAAAAALRAQQTGKLDAVLQAHVDGHMHEILQQLEQAGHPALGIVVGIMHDGETSASWSISDQVRGEDGEPASPQSVAHQIALDLVSATENE